MLLFSCFTLIGRLIVTTSGMYSMWSKFCAEQFTESDKAEALALSFVQSFATSLVLNTNGGEIEVQVTHCFSIVVSLLLTNAF